MAAVLNARADLTKLSDAELAERLEEMWARHDSIEKIWGGVTTRRWVEWLLPLNSWWTRALMHADGDADLILREIEDLTDQMNRRVGGKAGANA
jgi:hypothetical protein